ncbi:MAG: hypothetical protein WA895_12445, partial [Streptosporangiaceae bacterium]
MSTSVARSLTGWLTVALFFAPAGSLLRDTGLGQLARWPSAASVQLVRCRVGAWPVALALLRPGCGV